MAEKTNKAQLAKIHGVSEQTLTEWQAEGMPVEKRGGRGAANTYDTAATIEWRIERDVRKVRGAEGVKDRLARLQGDKLEQELAERNRVLVPTDEIEPVWMNRVMAACAFIMSGASRLAGILEATPGVEAKRQILKEEAAAFLNQLGVDGPRMQQAVEDLLAKVSSAEADAFLKKIAGHDDPSCSTGAA